MLGFGVAHWEGRKMHVQSRSRAIVLAVASVLLVGCLGGWLVSAGGDSQDPGSGASAQPSSAAPTDDKTVAKPRRAKSTKAGKAKAGDNKSGATKSGDAKTGDSTPSSTSSPKSGDGDDKSDQKSDQTNDDSSEDEQPTPDSLETVPVTPVETKEPVPLDSVGDFETGLTVQLASIDSVQADAKAPGEISGPGLRVTVAASNEKGSPVSLDGVVVFLSYGDDQAPASLFGTSSEPLRGELAGGESRTGTYVFAVPPDQRGDVRVEISYTGSAPTVAFTGSVDG